MEVGKHLKRHLMASLGVLLIVVIGTSLACQSIGAGGGGAKTVKIGVVGPLTGDWAAGGQSQLNGAILKKEELAKADPDVKIEILSEDDAAKCEQSVNATTKLIEQAKVQVILGALNSPCSLAMVPVTAKAEVPQFTVSVGTAITEQGSKYIFRVALSAKGQTKELAEYAVKQLGLKKIGIMYTNDEYGKSGAEGMRAALKALGLEPAIYETWTINDKDFSGQLSKLKAAGADALYATGSYTDAALIAKQMRQMGLEKVQLLGDTGLATPDFIRLGGEAVEGTLLVEPFTPAATDETTQKFVKAFKERFGREPDSWAAEFYDTVGMIYEAVKKTGKTDAKSIRDYVAGLKKGQGYKGVMGEISFDEKGDPQYALYKVQIKGGQKVILGR